MLCDVCHKNSATVHLTEIVNDKVVEMHLCQPCAKSKTDVFKEQFNIADFLGGLLDVADSSQKEETVACPVCGLTFENFKKKGRFGCAGCYEAFRRQLLPLLKRIHSADHHVGKIPGKVPSSGGIERKIKELQDKLERAIKLEEYEEAARLKDRLNDLEKEKAARSQGAEAGKEKDN